MHLEKLGVEIEKLTKEQSQYIGVSKKGPFKSRVGILVISNLLEESLNYSISIPRLYFNQHQVDALKHSKTLHFYNLLD